MTIRELDTAYETHRVITYNYNDTKAVYHNIRMRPYTGTLYIGEPETDDYGNNYCMAYAWFEDAHIGIAMHKYADNRSIEHVDNEAIDCGLMSVQDFIAYMKKEIDANEWLTLLQVELLKNVDPSLVPAAMESRRLHKEAVDAKRREHERKRKEDEAVFVAARNEEANAVIAEALRVLKDGGKLENKSFILYKDRYDYQECHVVSYLMDKFGIALPIRTKGWIINSLANMTIGASGEIEGCQYYKRGKSRGSQSVWTYLSRLVEAARATVEEVEGCAG